MALRVAAAMSQLDWLRAWIASWLLLLCLALLPAPMLLDRAELALHTTLRRCLLPEQQIAAMGQAQTWATNGWLAWRSELPNANPPATKSSTPDRILNDKPGTLSQTLAQGQQYLFIISLRLALLLAILPTYGLLLLAVMIDGWIARRVRQASFRPSSALWHRLGLVGVQASFWLVLSYVFLPLPWPWWWLLGLAPVSLLCVRVLVSETQKRL